MDQCIYEFDRRISAAKSSDESWSALCKLSACIAGHKLFTVMTVDMGAGLARRAFSDHPLEYPVSGAKPIHRDSWFDIVHGQRRSFVANTLDDIAKVFPDFELIGSLGCGSVLNLPIILEGELAATINILNAEHYYTVERVGELESKLSLSGKLCYALAARFGTKVLAASAGEPS